MHKKIICFDLDNVICTNIKYKNKDLINYNKSKPIKKSVKIINQLYNHGYIINIFTSRGMTRYNGDLSIINKKLKKLTTCQLNKWKVKYHNLIFGKPSYDLFIDDKSLNFNSQWNNSIEQLLI
jgi:hypothetical protein